MPVPRGEEVEHYVHIWKHKIPMDNGRRLASRQQAIAIGLQLERKRAAEARKRKMAKSKKKKKQGRRRRKKNPSGWLTAKDPMFGLPNWMVAGSVVAAGLIWYVAASASDQKQADNYIKTISP